LYSRHHRYLHSFPTRRSSDLAKRCHLLIHIHLLFFLYILASSSLVPSSLNYVYCISVGAKKQNRFIFICVDYSSCTILYRIIHHFIFLHCPSYCATTWFPAYF